MIADAAFEVWEIDANAEKCTKNEMHHAHLLDSKIIFVHSWVLIEQDKAIKLLSIIDIDSEGIERETDRQRG